MTMMTMTTVDQRQAPPARLVITSQHTAETIPEFSFQHACSPCGCKASFLTLPSFFGCACNLETRLLLPRACSSPLALAFKPTPLPPLGLAWLAAGRSGMTSPFFVLPRHQNDVPDVQNILRRLTASFLTLDGGSRRSTQRVGGHAGERAPSFWAPNDVSSGLILSQVSTCEKGDEQAESRSIVL